MAFPSISTAAQKEVVGHEIEVRTPAVAAVCKAAGASAVAGPAGMAATAAQVTQARAAVTTGRQIAVRRLDENVPMARVTFLIDETQM